MTTGKKKPPPKKKPSETFIAINPSTGKPLPRKKQPKTKGPGHSKGGDKPTQQQINQQKKHPVKYPKNLGKPKNPKPSRPPANGGGSNNSGGGSYQSQANRYHSIIPAAPTHDTSYTPDSAFAAQTMQNLKQLHDSMSQDDFAALMQHYNVGTGASTGGEGDPSGNGFLGQQASTGTGQMGFQIDYTVDQPSNPLTIVHSGDTIDTSDPSGNLQQIQNNPPNPGNFPGNPPRQYPGGGGIPSPGGGGSGFGGQGPGRPGGGPIGIPGRPGVHIMGTAAATPAQPSRQPVVTPTSTQQGSQPSNDPNDPNALATLEQMLGQWGLGGLTGVVMDYLQQGYDATSIQYLLTQTPEYKRRFAANDARAKNGLGVLSPSEYLATERAYQDVLRSAGLPSGFYDSPDDFTQWLSNDVSPTELANRVDDAVKFAQSTDPTYRTALSAYFGIDTGHIAAYFLDSQRALPLLQKQANASAIGAAAIRQGLNLTDLNRAFQFSDQGVTEQQAQQGYSAIAGFLPEEKRLAGQFGQSYDQGTAEDEVLGGLASAARKRNRLNQSEEALFGGSGGVGDTLYHPNYGLQTATQGAY